MPPKPKLFDSTALIGRSCALQATWSIMLSRLGESRLRVGGATPALIAITDQDRLGRSRRAEHVPGGGLGRGHGQALYGIAK